MIWYAPPTPTTPPPPQVTDGPQDILWAGIIVALLFEAAAWIGAKLLTKYREDRDRKRFDDVTRGFDL